MPSKQSQPQGKGAKRPTKQGSKAKAGGDSLLEWFGRQVGHVKKAVETDVTQPAKKGRTGADSRGQGPSGKQAPRADPVDPASQPHATVVLYRQDTVEEAEVPHRPGVKVRRTTIDEVIVEKIEPAQ